MTFFIICLSMAAAYTPTHTHTPHTHTHTYTHPKHILTGLFSCIMRDLANTANDCPKWIVLDGDIDPMWIESLNTVMDDNKVRTHGSCYTYFAVTSMCTVVALHLKCTWYETKLSFCKNFFRHDYSVTVFGAVILVQDPTPHRLIFAVVLGHWQCILLSFPNTYYNS